MTATTRTFPLDGFADTCVGYGNAADGGCDPHGTNDELVQGLCTACDRRLRLEVSTSRLPVARPNDCPTGYCKDHTHGSRYYDCLCCYGD